jgi:hypothetical protein
MSEKSDASSMRAESRTSATGRTPRSPILLLRGDGPSSPRLPGRLAMPGSMRPPRSTYDADVQRPPQAATSSVVCSGTHSKSLGEIRPPGVALVEPAASVARQRLSRNPLVRHAVRWLGTRPILRAPRPPARTVPVARSSRCHSTSTRVPKSCVPDRRRRIATVCSELQGIALPSSLVGAGFAPLVNGFFFRDPNWKSSQTAPNQRNGVIKVRFPAIQRRDQASTTTVPTSPPVTRARIDPGGLPTLVAPNCFDQELLFHGPSEVRSARRRDERVPSGWHRGNRVDQR